MKHTLLTISAFLLVGNALLFKDITPHAHTMANTNMGMENRAMPGSFMAETMRDNILLTTAYMRGIVHDRSNIDWNEVRKPFEYTFTLKPGEVFTFQKDVLPEYESSVVKTIDVNFGAQDGYKHDGYLMGDGVCHLASILYKAAKDAGIHAYAPTNHDFMPIPEVEREYGVSIYSIPGEKTANAMQNLYIKNDKSEPVKFRMVYDGTKLSVEVISEENHIQSKIII